jgi:hypothetical protein
MPQDGRLTQSGVFRAPLLSPDKPFEHVVSTQPDVVLARGSLVIHLNGSTLHFPDGRSEGDVYVQSLFGPEIAYPITPISIPLMAWSVQPMGIDVQGSPQVDFTIPKPDLYDDYVSSLPERVLLVGLDPDMLAIAPIGVGTVDKSARRVRSEGVLQMRRLDFIGITPFPSAAAQKALADYGHGTISLPQLVSTLTAR